MICIPPWNRTTSGLRITLGCIRLGSFRNDGLGKHEFTLLIKHARAVLLKGISANRDDGAAPGLLDITAGDGEDLFGVFTRGRHVAAYTGVDEGNRTPSLNFGKVALYL